MAKNNVSITRQKHAQSCWQNDGTSRLKIIYILVIKVNKFREITQTWGEPHTVLSVRFEVDVSLLLAPAGADKRDSKAPFPLVENAGIQLVICKRVPAGAPAGAGSY